MAKFVITKSEAIFDGVGKNVSSSTLKVETIS